MENNHLALAGTVAQGRTHLARKGIIVPGSHFRGENENDNTSMEQTQTESRISRRR